jgi:hypothetical protein
MNLVYRTVRKLIFYIFSTVCIEYLEGESKHKINLWINRQDILSLINYCTKCIHFRAEQWGNNLCSYINYLSFVWFGEYSLPTYCTMYMLKCFYSTEWFWCVKNPLHRQVGGGWALEISTFLGPKWHSPTGSMPFHRAQKSLDSQGPTPFNLPT